MRLPGSGAPAQPEKPEARHPGHQHPPGSRQRDRCEPRDRQDAGPAHLMNVALLVEWGDCDRAEQAIGGSQCRTRRQHGADEAIVEAQVCRLVEVPDDARAGIGIGVEVLT